MNNTNDPAAKRRTRMGDSELDRMKRTALIEFGMDANRTSVDVFKWTLGSLLVVNGGALVALLGSDLRKAAFDEAALFFGGGLLLAILGGIFWMAAFTLVGNDHLRRAWDAAEILPDDFEQPKFTKATVRWVIAASVSWAACFTLFVMGCISIAYVPERSAWEAADQEDEAATYRYVSAAQDFIDLSKDDRATREELRAAEQRARMAQIDADIASDKFNRLLNPEERELRQKTREATRRLKRETATALNKTD